VYIVSLRYTYVTSLREYTADIRGGGTASIKPAEEWKSPRHMQHSPRAAEVRGHRRREMYKLNVPSFSLSGALASFLTTGAALHHAALIQKKGKQA